ncbi:calcium/sodium antiporter [Jannaschia sp. Os4]|uniref:calcium/sodium antiporter n=1 Tax=Jannaschia sp. Os4 TaxID=2807617 RepID=UPI00193AD6A0|nr:calcium/sodium antiporter [Jannaschia sp. Os4]MBM2575348.1 calcium/sodium antiporter [Jannaschia sp. Os4]
MLLLSLGSGLLLLVAGGDALVRGAASLAARWGVSPLLIGLTVVGFGTSTPELVTSLQAAFAGAPGVAVGNVVGSNVANALLILGIAAVAMPFAVDRAAFRRDGTMLALATLAGAAVVLSGGLSRGLGLMLLAGLALYLWTAWRGERDAPQAAGDVPGPLLRAVVLTVAGIAATVLGARLLVGGATGLAQAWGVSEAVIGLTVVAVGTSLPELVTSLVAAVKRQGAMAFGNVVGSNVFNLLGILGATAVVVPIPVPPEIASRDVWVMLAATVALVVVAVTGWRVRRGEGVALLAAYGGYMAWLAMG